MIAVLSPLILSELRAQPMTDQFIPLQDRLKRIFDDAGGSDTLADLLAEFDFEGSRELAEVITAAIAGNAALEAENARLREAGNALAGAVERLKLRELVAGWNGENRAEGPYEPHPAKLGITLRTNAGTVYALDAALATWSDDRPEARA